MWILESKPQSYNVPCSQSTTPRAILGRLHKKAWQYKCQAHLLLLFLPVLPSPWCERCQAVTTWSIWIQEFRGKPGTAKVPLGSVNSNEVLVPWLEPLRRQKWAANGTGGGDGLPGTLKFTMALQYSSRSAFTTHVWLELVELIVNFESLTVRNFLSPSCMSAKIDFPNSGQSGASCFLDPPSSTQAFKTLVGGASFPLGSVNSKVAFSMAPSLKFSEAHHNVIRSFTGGGFGFPGTLKSMSALQVSSFNVLVTCHFWSFPCGLISTTLPSIVTSFWSPSCMSAKTALILLGHSHAPQTTAMRPRKAALTFNAAMSCKNLQVSTKVLRVLSWRMRGASWFHGETTWQSWVWMLFASSMTFWKSLWKWQCRADRWYKTAPGTWWTSRNLSLRHFWPMPLQLEHLGLLSTSSESIVVTVNITWTKVNIKHPPTEIEQFNLGRPTPFGLNMAQFLSLKPVNQNGSEVWIARRVTASIAPVPHFTSRTYSSHEQNNSLDHRSSRHIQLYGKTLSRYIQNEIVR